MRRQIAAILIALAAPLLAPSAAAQEAVAPSEALDQRADDVLRLLQGEPIEQGVFTANFLNAIPPEQFRQVVRQFASQHGPPLALESIEAKSPNEAVLKIRFEKSLATATLTIEAAPPHRIAGLLITGFEAAGNNIADVVAAIDALPSRKGLLVQRLDGDAAPLASLDPDGRYAIGSTFKLYILAELDRAVRAGERDWSDVVELGPRSHPSGISQSWPEGSAVTLQTLATLMISISDNTATDTLIRVIGQDRLAAIVGATGHGHPGDLHPFLMTRESSALKMPVNEGLRAQFVTAGEGKQARLIRDNADAFALDRLDAGFLTGQPNHIDEIEWFASPADTVRLLDWLRRNASKETRAILAVNPGIGSSDAGKWAYLGYKGGSEPGVLSLNFLAQAKSGGWYAVSAHWNDTDAPVAEGTLIALVTRLMNLLTEIDGR